MSLILLPMVHKFQTEVLIDVVMAPDSRFTCIALKSSKWNRALTKTIASQIVLGESPVPISARQLIAFQYFNV